MGASPMPGWGHTKHVLKSHKKRVPSKKTNPHYVGCEYSLESTNRGSLEAEGR